MAVVITSEESSYFAPSALRRSHSQSKFASRQPSGIHSSSSASRIHDHYSQPVKIFADSSPSTAPSSPRTLQPSTGGLSYSSTPSSNLSFSTESEGNDESLLHDLSDENDIFFPVYNGYLDTTTPEELEPPPSPRAGGSPGNGTSTSTSDSRTPDIYEPGAVDDSAVGIQPTRHVDYLSHDWKEEDIWSSWKHIVSNREEFNNAARLENASWRTWIKAKNHLKTVSPETLNWLKDCDVTWLYGPLLTGKKIFLSGPEEPVTSSAGFSKSNSFIQSQSKKKPILKKRSMSEVMLQKSLSSSSLIKQAAAAVQAQEKALPRGLGPIARPKFERAATDYVTFPFSSRRMSREQLSVGPSSSTSGVISPNSERKHIHFNEQVEQCIAVDVKGDDDDDDDAMESDMFNYDSDSDDGMIMMKKTATKKRRPAIKRKTSCMEKKSINMLPPTTLKYREDTPEPQETAMKHSYRSPTMSPSSSQETLRPSKPSGKKMFFVDDDDDDDDEMGSFGDFSDGLKSPPPGGFSSSGFHRTSSANNLNAVPSGMRRTESGMFMPYEEGESASEGIVGFVLDTKKKGAQKPRYPRDESP